MSVDLAADLRMALDPAAFMATTVAPPDPWQEQVLRSTARRTLLLCTRQAGKSTVTAAKAMHKALYTPGSLTLMLSPSLRQSRELFAKAMTVYRVMGKPVPAEIENRLELELSNGSRIVALPGTESSIRGYSNVDLLIIDEAARVLDELYASVRPMLAVSGGELIALTTGWGRRGWFFEAWSEGGEAWERVRITAHDIPRIADEFLEEERRSMPDWFFRQEYLAEFADTIDQLFGSDMVRSALRDDVLPLFGAPEMSHNGDAGVHPLFGDNND